MNNKDFREICDDYHLPLIARNCLENGRSTNLWHEQVVPRESRFYFFLLKPHHSKYELEFKKGDPVQIGGNASIGYGFTQIEKVADPGQEP
jgi:CRISPR-associated protein Cmr4